MKRGFTLVELIVYVSVLAALLLMFSNSLLAIGRSYGQLKVIRDLDSAATVSMERITREIRSSSAVDLEQSILGTIPGTLVLDQIDVGGNTATIKLNVVDSAVHLWSDDVDEGSLLPMGVTVTKLLFYFIDTGMSKGVKVEMQLGKRIGQVTRTANYYSTIILRGSYK